MDTPIIDFHSHVGRMGNFNIYDDQDWYVRTLDAAGVDRSFVSYVFHGEARRCNNFVAEFVAMNPDRFGGFAFVTPHYIEEAIPDDVEEFFLTIIGEGQAAQRLPNGLWVGSLTHFNTLKGYWVQVSDDFDFNQDLEFGEEARSPGWIRYQKKLNDK